MRNSNFFRDKNGATAVEFAFIAPVFLLMLYGIIAFGVIAATMAGVQQLAAESARASVGGLDDAEASAIARNYVADHVAAYPFLDATKISVSTSSVTGAVPTFAVNLGYDMTNGIAYALGNLVPLPQPRFTRTAVVVKGGY